MTTSCSSDARFKSNIQDTGDELVWLGDLRIRDFTWNATGERRTGVIAQEVKETHPEMVHTDDKGFYTVDEPNPWKIIKAIQELKDMLFKDHGLLTKLQALFESDHEEIARLKAANDSQAKAIEELRAMALKQQEELEAYKKAHP